MVTVFGATGYIGSRYCELFDAVAQPRHNLVPRTPKILYMISTTHNHHLATNPYIDIDTNLTMLIRVLENLRHTPDAEINFVSSWFVYGARSSPADERTMCNPQGFYSITKRTAEQLLMAYCEHHGIRWRIMRLSNIIGGRDHRADHSKNILQRMAVDLLAHRDITLANTGNFLRDYLHRDDACAAMSTVIEHGESNRIYNIGQGHSIRFREAIDYIQQQTQSRSTLHNSVNYDVIDCVLDCARINKLGWRPRLTWQQAIDDLLLHC